MTEKRDLKQLIRERMAETGESFATARRMILANRPESPDPQVLVPMAWTPFRHVSEPEAERLIADALEREPRLRGWGFDDVGEATLDNEFVRKSVRELVTRSRVAVAECAGWIKSHVGRKSKVVLVDAAQIHHVVQRLTDLRGGQKLWRPFVIPSAAIAAAVGLGLEPHRIDKWSDARFAFELADASVFRSRSRITEGVCRGRGVHVFEPPLHESTKRRGGSAASLVHFLELADVGFVGVVDAEDPERGPYTRYADVPVEDVEIARANGFRTLTDAEMERVDYERVGDVEDYSWSKYGD